MGPREPNQISHASCCSVQSAQQRLRGGAAVASGSPNGVCGQRWGGRVGMREEGGARTAAAK